MKVYVPAPYPDELLSSVAARYYAHAGGNKGWRGQLALFGAQVWSNSLLPSRLADLAPILDLGLSAERIAEELTILPYQVAFMSPEMKETKLSRMMHNFRSKPANFENVRTPLRLNMVFCRECREEDLQRFGETYWRRSHHLPGVSVCHEHGSILVETQVPVRSFQSIAVDATTATEHVVRDDRVVDPVHLASAFMIARQCQRLLEGGMGGPTLSQALRIYRNAARRRGFYEGAQLADARKLKEDFLAMFPLELLQLIGVNTNERLIQEWLKSVFRSFDRVFCPLEHILIQSFILSAPLVKTSPHPFGRGPWYCPNPLDHHKGPTIREITIKKRNKQLTAIAHCPCGFSFSFRSCEGNDLQRPVPFRRTQLPNSWSDHCRELRSEGLHTTAIARANGLTRARVQQLLQRPKCQSVVLNGAVLGDREQWEALVASVPYHSTTVAAKLSPHLFERLMAKDQAWMLSRARSSRLSKPRSRVDWAARDKEWSARIRETAKVLRADLSGPRVTSALIQKRAGLRFFARKMKNLPEAQAALAHEKESGSDYAERLIRHKAEELVAAGEAMTTSDVLKRLSARLRAKLDAERVEALIKGLPDIL